MFHRRLFHLISGPLFISVTMLVSGCLEMEQKITIREDGSAAVSLSYSIPEEDYRFFQEMQDLIQEQQTGTRPETAEERLWMFNEEQARSHFNQSGMSLQSYEQGTNEQEGRRYASIVFNLDDLRESIQAGHIGNFMLESADRTEKEDREAHIFRFRMPAHVQEQQISRPRGEHAETLEKLLEKVEINIVVETPRPIISATGEITNEDIVRWSLSPGEENDYFLRPPEIEVKY